LDSRLRGNDAEKWAVGGIGGMTKYKFPRGQIRIPACASDSLANQTACNRQICRNLLPPPWGRAGEAAFSKLRQSFPTA
ncbi:TPA: hypothetical protein ACK39N_002153, partial [Neisseria gonorrhoeae]